MKKTSILISLVWLFLLSVGLVSAKPDAVLKLSPEKQKEFLFRLEGNLKASKTIQANFTQEKHLPLFKDALVSRGMFAFAAPDRLRWEITEPFHSLLIMNGREMEKYDFPDGKKPRKLNFPAKDALFKILGQIADIHQGNFAAEEKVYEIGVYQGKTASLTLIPKIEKMKRIIPEIRIEFSEKLDSVTSVVIRESGGDSTRIVFEDNQLNPKLPYTLFSVQ